ncbi:MAG: hypothetical protein ACYC0X_16195 [Pirellulaceae bacterium]
MLPIFRQLTAALVLASYLLASAATWLHTDHLHSASRGPSCGEKARCCSPCGGFAESTDPDGEQAHAVRRGIEGNEESPGEHGHQGDRCLLCRFLVIKKWANSPAGPTVSSENLPQPVVQAIPAIRVALLQATPDCRAPPLVG